MPRVMNYEIDPNGIHRKMAQGFHHREPGFAMSVDSNDKLSESSTQKIFGGIGSLISVAMFEQRGESF